MTDRTNVLQQLNEANAQLEAAKAILNQIRQYAFESDFSKIDEFVQASDYMTRVLDEMIKENPHFNEAGQLITNSIVQKGVSLDAQQEQEVLGFIQEIVARVADFSGEVHANLSPILAEIQA